MKALVYTNPNEMTYVEQPAPSAATGEVLIRVEAVGICGSDMHAYHGRDPRRVPPLILGHELAGEVLEGPSALAGKRVTVNPLITCGHCEYCVQGRNNLCANRTMIGMTRAGGFADYVTTAAASVIELPDGMSARAAALTEPAATALHALNAASRVLARPLPECAVLVIGGGAIGLLAGLLLRSYGCRRVHMSESNPLRRDAAARATGWPVHDPAGKGLPHDSFDLVVDAVGAASTRDAALASVKPGGAVVHVGLAQGSSVMDMRKLTLAEIALVGVYTYSTADLRASVRGLHEGAFGDLAWIEERPLSEGARAFQDLDQGRSAAAKILLRP